MTNEAVLENIAEELAGTETAGDDARIDNELLEGSEEDAAGGEKAKKEGADTSDKDGKDTYKPKGEDEQLPWDKDRQKRDQEAANRRKTEDSAITALAEEIKSLRQEVQTLRAGEQPKTRSADDIKVDIDKLEADLDEIHSNQPDEYATDEEKAAYTKREAGLRGRRKVLNAELFNAAKAATNQPTKAEEPVKAETSKPEAVTQDEYYAILDEADKEFGAEFRRTVAREMTAFLRERTDKPPTRAQVEAKVFRLYGKYAVEAVRKAKTSAGTSPRSQAVERSEPSPARAAEERFDAGMTTDQYVEQRLRRRRHRA